MKLAKPAPVAPATTGITVPGDGYKHAGKITVEAMLTFNYEADGITVAELDAGQRIFGPSNGINIRVQIVGTDCTTQLYKQLTSFINPETPPVGIAQAVYTALAQLNYEGELTLKETECSGFFSLKNTVNITGSENAQWASMAAQIKEVDEDIDAGVTSVKIGPPTHLSPQDLVELLRAARVAVPSATFSERADGKNSKTPVVDGTAQSATNNGARSGDSKPPLPWAPINNYDGSVSLNPNSFLYDLDGVNLVVISNLTGILSKFAPNIGDVLYLKIPLTADCAVDTSMSNELVLASAGTLANYPVHINTSDPANVWQDWAYINLLQFVATTDPRDGDLWMFLSDGTTKIKVIQLVKTNLKLVGANTFNQAIFGVAIVPYGSPGTT